MLDQQPSSTGDVEICMNFIGHGEPKRARTFSKAFSRSPTVSNSIPQRPFREPELLHAPQEENPSSEMRGLLTPDLLGEKCFLG
jgi:hypothetical protein